MASPQMAASSIRPNLNEHWVTVAEYALVMQRAERTIYQWLKDGTLTEFNIPTYQDKSGKWWIKVTVSQ